MNERRYIMVSDYRCEDECRNKGGDVNKPQATNANQLVV